ALLFNTELSAQFSGPRSDVRLFAWTDNSSGGGWHSVPHQVDPVDDNGFLMFFPDSAFLLEPVQKNDVIIFNVDTFGRQVDLRKKPLPCQGASVYQLFDLIGKKYAYLTQCQNSQGEQLFPQQVRFNAKENFLETDTY